MDNRYICNTRKEKLTEPTASRKVSSDVGKGE